MDPVIDYSASPYNGYDNNPVFWADPSGADVTYGNNSVTATGADIASLMASIGNVLDDEDPDFQIMGIENSLFENSGMGDPPGGKPSYTPPPKELPGFPDAEKVKRKGGRPRWRLPNGEIIEWDGQHGELERYNKRGKHTGVWSPEGEMIKDPVPGRKINPFTTPSTLVLPTPKSNPFMEKMAKVTGLTGTALIIYLVISEGSRLFPPRNLIPIP